MAEESRSGRVYTDKQIGEVLKRATEMQAESEESRDRSLSLAEIEGIAAELGIEAQYVRAAASAVDSGRGDGGFSLSGFPFVASHHGAVEGEIDGDGWEEAVLELRRLTGEVGKTGRLGQAREWSDAGEVTHTHVTLSGKEGRTVVQVTYNYNGAAALSYMGSFFFTAVATGIGLDGSNLPDTTAVAIVAGAGSAGVAAMRAGLHLWAGRQRRRVERLAAGLHRFIAGRAGSEEKLPPAGEGEAPDEIERAKEELGR